MLISSLSAVNLHICSHRSFRRRSSSSRITPDEEKEDSNSLKLSINQSILSSKTSTSIIFRKMWNVTRSDATISLPPPTAQHTRYFRVCVGNQWLASVEASSQCRPRPVVLPQVPQIPVTLVLYQAQNLLTCQSRNKHTFSMIYFRRMLQQNKRQLLKT